ncbi:MAG TPA: UDP-N-acetylglucosamine 2-epimerase (non-hydrolyzing) [bacterium]|mgnify:CR=1 FL=1|nr:UDP-N-acetylglucosamine 2-epimerase (non-hydrolyzing) [bacterium]
MKILNVVGARPNFMKIGPLCRAFESRAGIESLLVHTGQHYDQNMSRIFFDDLELPRPDMNLGVGSGTHGVQTARVMESFEKVLMENRPDLVIVVGDVNSTLACSLSASKLGIAVAHVEAGLRSFDRSMPEEINRIVTDTLSDFLFVSERSGVDNLLNEGIARDKIFFVGNIMIDTLVLNLERIKSRKIESGVPAEDYAVLTMHRPSNVDNPETFEIVVRALLEGCGGLPVFFPVHPRTRERINKFGLKKYFREFDENTAGAGGLILMDPLGALEFLALMKNAKLVLTDSGGIQEETTYLKVPCITLRENTERPVTVEIGTNVIAGSDPVLIKKYISNVLEGRLGESEIPEMWDGKTGERIAGIIVDKYKSVIQ